MDLKELIEFILQAGILKNLPRTGWLLRGIKGPESVAEHSYRTALISMLLGDLLNKRGAKINLEKVIRIALLHDLAEAAVGDIAPKASKYLGAETKKASEEEALKDMAGRLGQVGQVYRRLWSEFSQGRSVESKVVRAADKLEMVIQAYEYERAGFRNLDDFWENLDQISGWDVDGIVDQLIGLLKGMREEVARSEAISLPRRKGP